MPGPFLGVCGFFTETPTCDRERNEGMDPCSGPSIMHYNSLHVLFLSFENASPRSLPSGTWDVVAPGGRGAGGLERLQ